MIPVACLALAASLTNTPTPVPVEQTVITIQGRQGFTGFNNDSLYFDISLTGPNTSDTTTAVFDTGADALQIPLKLGEALGLPYEGSDTMTGLVVGAVEDTYDSHVDFTIDSQTFKGVPCVVGGDLGFVIFGMQFVRDRHLNADIDFADNVVTLSEPLKATVLMVPRSTLELWRRVE